MKHGSLFSGIGGFDLAATWMGWTNVFYCEKDRFCGRVLKYYWPQSDGYEDIRAFSAIKYRGLIDVLSGGFPCQPFSIAGRRKGTADDRYLWPEMCRIIGEVRPRWVVGENVPGLLNWGRGMVFEQVQADLEAQGYKVWAVILPAAGVGAPHRRDRIWFIAHADNPHRTSEVEERKEPKRQGRPVRDNVGPDGKIRPIANSNGNECDAGHPFPERSRASAFTNGGPSAFSEHSNWQNFPTESPLCIRNDGLSIRLDGIAFSKWRSESIRGAGNAIVPQVALQIFRVIKTMEKQILKKSH
jgi:DNA (cytosine-5)-methyltransferase 1